MAGKHDEGYDEDSLKNEEYEQSQQGGPLIAIEKTIDGDRFRIMGKGTTIYKRGQCEGNGYTCTDDKECKVWVEKDRMVSVLPSPGHEQAWADIKLTEECMKEEEEAKKWAEAQLKYNLIDQEELRKGFNDMIVHGQEKYHITEEGIKHIPIWNDHVEGEPGRVEEYGASMYLQDESAVQQSIIQSYEQYMNPPDAEIHERMSKMVQEAEEQIWGEKPEKANGIMDRITTTDHDGIQEQHQIGYCQQVPDSQWVSTLEQILANIITIKDRADLKDYDKGSREIEGVTWVRITSIQEDIDHLKIAIENSIKKGMYIKQDGKE